MAVIYFGSDGKDDIAHKFVCVCVCAEKRKFIAVY